MKCQEEQLAVLAGKVPDDETQVQCLGCQAEFSSDDLDAMTETIVKLKALISACPAD
jgi:hypothetical protein